MPSTIAPNPVVPRFGVAVAALGQEDVVSANPLWRSLGALLDPPHLRPGQTVCYQPLHFAHHRLPVWAALARPEDSRHWPQIDQLSPATPARLHALAFLHSRAPEFTRRAAYSFRLADTERDTLGQARANAVKAVLLADNSLDPARIFLNTQTAVTLKDNRPTMELKIK